VLLAKGIDEIEALKETYIRQLERNVLPSLEQTSKERNPVNLGNGVELVTGDGAEVDVAEDNNLSE